MKRFRTYRTSQEVRDKYADVSVDVKDFIYPYFVVEGKGVRDEISTMPGGAKQGTANWILRCTSHHTMLYASGHKYETGIPGGKEILL